MQERLLRCARRTGPTERAAKWSRRHRNFVASVFVVLILSVVGLSVSALLISQQRDAARLAPVEAKTQRTRAAGNLRQARAAVDRMFTKVAEDMADRPHMEQLRRELLKAKQGKEVVVRIGNRLENWRSSQS